MASPIATPIRAILLAVRAQLALVTEIPEDRVLLAARSRVPKFSGDADLIVRVSPPAPVEEYQRGGNRTDLAVERIVSVTARVRLSQDISDDDRLLLVDEDFGLFRLEEKAIDALAGWLPQDGSDWLTTMPLFWVQGGGVEKDAPESQGWAGSTVSFKARYLPVLRDNSF